MAFLFLLKLKPAPSMLWNLLWPYSTMELAAPISVQDSLQWRHNGRDSVSNHQPHDCLLNRLFRRRSKKPPKLRVTGFCAEKCLNCFVNFHILLPDMETLGGWFPYLVFSSVQGWYMYGILFLILWYLNAAEEITITWQAPCFYWPIVSKFPLTAISLT